MCICERGLWACEGNLVLLHVRTMKEICLWVNVDNEGNISLGMYRQGRKDVLGQMQILACAEIEGKMSLGICRQ